MKSKALILLLALASSTAQAARLSSKPDQDVFLSVAIGNYLAPSIGYEASLENRVNSIAADLAVSTSGGSGYYVSSFGLGASYRFWMMQEERLSGVFVGPKVYAQNFNVSYDVTVNGARRSESLNSLLFGVGGEGGYQWIIDKQLLINAGAELRYLAGGLNLVAGAPSFTVSGIGLGLKVSVGYAF